MKNFFKFAFFILVMMSVSSVHASNAVQLLQDKYQQQGATAPDLQQAQNFWLNKNGDRSCTSCHSADLFSIGKHAKTGKPIQPMAISINAKRYQEAKKIEKWFLRNCKWTLGRECTSQEKMNLLSWLSSQ